jgi:hypothetical protein
LNLIIDNLKNDKITISQYPNSDYNKIIINEVDFYNLEDLKMEENDAIELVTFLIEKFKLKPYEVGIDINE